MLKGCKGFVAGFLSCAVLGAEVYKDKSPKESV